MFEANLNKLRSELELRGYCKKSITSAFNKVKDLPRLPTLQKITRPNTKRQILVIPYDKRLPNISKILHHRWKCMLDRDPTATLYMPLPPRVSYCKTSSLRDILVRAKVPTQQQARSTRQATLGFKKCGKHGDCSVCSHSVNITSHSCNNTGESWPI